MILNIGNKLTVTLIRKERTEVTVTGFITTSINNKWNTYIILTTNGSNDVLTLPVNSSMMKRLNIIKH